MAATAELVVRVLTDTEKAQSGIKKYADSFKSVKGAVKAAAVPAAAALVALGAAAISAGNAAADDAQAAAVLAQGLKNSTGATQAQIDATEEYIDKMAKATGVADDQLRPAMAALARGSGDVETAQKDLAIALDTSVATGKDVQSISEAIAKAYGGNTASLKKLVPTLDEATLASGDMNKIMADLAKQTGGSAAAAADTAAGKMARMKVAMGEAQEEIGAALLPAMAKLATVLATVAGFIQKHPRLFMAFAIAVGVLAAAIMVANVAMTIAAIAEAAMLWPILLIVAAVAALIVVIVLVVKHFDAIKKVGVAAWNAIKAAAVTVWNAIKRVVVAAFSAIKTTISGALAWIRSHWQTILAILSGPIGLAVLAIAKNWQRIKDGFQGVKDRISTIAGTLKDIITKPFDAAKSAIDKVVSAARSLIHWIGQIVKPVDLAAPFNAAKSAIDTLIGGVRSLISWLGKIKIPSLGKLGGVISRVTGRSAASATAARAVSGVADTRGLAAPAPGVRAAPVGAVVINVTGALDPEAVARQINRILTGHNRRIGLVRS